MKKTFRFLWRGLLVLAGLVLLYWLALILRGEWSARAPRLAAAPPVAVPAGNGPVLIMLHGAGLNGHMWDAVRRGLDPRWRVITPDLPGHGARQAETFTLDGAVATVVAAAKAVAPAPVILVGDSLGGYTSMAAAAALPQEQLRGLVIGGCSGNFAPTKVFGYAGSLLMVHALTSVADEQKLLRKGMSARFGVSPGDAVAIIDAGASMRVVPEAVRALMFEDFAPKLAAVTQPVLIVNGTLDERSMEGEATFLALTQHGSNYHFENTEHGVSMRRPAEFAGIVNRFATEAFKP